MARDQVDLPVPVGVWTQLTNADVTSITFECLGHPVYIRFTTDETTPTEARGILYRHGQGEADRPVSELAELAGVDRVWAKPAGAHPSVVHVDHA